MSNAVELLETYKERARAELEASKKINGRTPSYSVEDLNMKRLRDEWLTTVGHDLTDLLGVRVRWVNKIDKYDNPIGSVGHFEVSSFDCMKELPGPERAIPRVDGNVDIDIDGSWVNVKKNQQ